MRSVPACSLVVCAWLLVAGSATAQEEVEAEAETEAETETESEAETETETETESEAEAEAETETEAETEAEAEAEPEAEAESEAESGSEAAAPAETEPPPAVRPQPPVAIQYTSTTAARVNPLGLVSFLDLAGRLRLYESDSDILKQNFVGLGFTGGLSPAWGRFGVLAEVQALTILRLYAQYEFLGYFGSFNLIPSFPSPYAEFSDTVIRDRGEMEDLPGYATYGGQLTLGATLQIKLGPFAARNLFRAVHGSYQLRAGDRVYYDQITDMLHPNDGFVIVNEVDALAVLDFGLTFGARWSYSHAFYDTGHFAPGEDPAAAPDNDIHRLGLLAAYTFEDNRGARFDRPTLILIAQWHLVHRYRTGQDVDTGLPYIALAFQFMGDLLADH
jgi:hypothetical protein